MVLKACIHDTILSIFFKNYGIMDAVMIDTEKKREDILTRAVGEFIDPDGSFKKKLQESPEKIIIKFGVDPTRPDIHLGHAVVLRKLRQLQDLGCKVVFLIGDFTAQIGDPTGKSKVRPEIDQIEVEKNMKTYLDQVGKILLTDPKVFSWIRNSDWYVSVNDIIAPNNRVINITIGTEVTSTPPLPSGHIINKAEYWVRTRMQKGNIKNYSFINILSVLSKMSFGRLIERDMFQNRLKGGEPIFMHELLYPVIQGIDSNVLSNIYGTCDMEVGGTDQHFNMLVGREVMEMNKKTPQAVLSFKLLVGTDGKEKMSKSLDNYISIIDEPSDMYGKVLSIPDTTIAHYFELCTFTPMDRIAEIEKEISGGNINPKDIKMELARQIVALYHGETKAQSAEQEWVSKFEKKEIPENLPEYILTGTLADLVVEQNILSSKSEYRRVIEGGGVHNLTTSERIEDISYTPKKGTVIKIGKQKFFKVI
jgi:tyrosyl-tRNA synthetase